MTHSKKSGSISHSASYSVAWIAVLFSTLIFGPSAIAQTILKIGPDTTISFPEKSAALTDEAKQELIKLIKDAKSNGTISEVQVAAWSDNPAPRAKEELSKPDRKLAESRAQAVNKYLSGRAKVSITTHNMAERASWLARAFETTDAELKTEIGRGGDAPMSKSEFQIFKNNGKPSKAVVLVILKH